MLSSTPHPYKSFTFSTPNMGPEVPKPLISIILNLWVDNPDVYRDTAWLLDRIIMDEGQSFCMALLVDIIFLADILSNNFGSSV